MKFDFSGYATKNDLKCTDGRTIRRDAFKDNDGKRVPLVWQHMHNDPANVLGHALLENREDGVYAYCKFNDGESGQNAKTLVKHGDVTALSIFANQLVQHGSDVIHGMIREVSLVLSGANPDAFIDNVTIMHSDGSEDISDHAAVIYTGLDFETDPISHADQEDEEETEENEETLNDVWETLNEKQQALVYAMISQAVTEATEEEEAEDEEEEDEKETEEDEDEEKDEALDHSSDQSSTESLKHSTKGENSMKVNVFNKEGTEQPEVGKTLSHAAISQIFDDARRGGSLRESMLSHAATYGIEDITDLFPEARLVDNMPSLISRDMAWVDEVMKGVKNSPFARIKSTAMDITAEEARARGYTKRGEKKEEVIKALKRVTLPTTIYKKQKLDRDDIIDIVDFDVVMWIKHEMKMMLDEERARAYLIGDGRSAGHADKINDDNIRPIYTDIDLYAHKVLVSNESVGKAIDDIIRSRKEYKGSGTPTLFVTNDFLTDMLLLKDLNQRYIYNNEKDLAVKLRVSNIVEVPVMENITREDTENDRTLELLGIIVNLKDYVVGADKGGKVSMFDDFDIDYNQHKYLIETRCSGALVQPKSALVLERVASDPL